MNNRIKKVNFLNIYSIGEYESWLSYMAKKGLSVEKINLFRHTFLKSEPCDKEYRVEFSDKPMTSERMNVYKEGGWEYVCSYKGVHIFTALLSRIDIHTDLKEQTLILNKIITKLTYLSVTMFILTMVTMFLGYGIISVGGTPHINFYDGDWGILGFVFGMMLLFISSVILLFRCSHIRRKLIHGSAINHHSDWKKSYVINLCFTNIILFVYLLYFTLVIVNINYDVINFVGLHNNNYYYSLSPDSKTTISIARLTDIEEYENPVLKQYSDPKKTNLYNNLKKEYGLFIMSHYEVRETFTSLSENNSSERILETDYYEMMLPSLADGVLDDLVKTSDHKYNGQKQSIVIKYESLDRVYFVQEAEGLYSLFIKKGNIVEHITYCGSQSYKVVLKAIAKSLN